MISARSGEVSAEKWIFETLGVARLAAEQRPLCALLPVSASGA